MRKKSALTNLQAQLELFLKEKAQSDQKKRLQTINLPTKKEFEKIRSKLNLIQRNNDNKYDAELKERGVGSVIKIGIALRGKEAVVKREIEEVKLSE